MDRAATTTVLAGTVLAALLTACGGGQSVTIQPATVSPRPPTSASDQAPATGDTLTTGDLKLTVTSVQAEGVEQQAVAAAWRQYWTERVTAFGTGTPPDPAELQQVATGEALDEVITDSKTLRDERHTLEGSFAFRVPSVQIAGDSATVVGCLAVDARERDAGGVVVQEITSLPPQITRLTRSGDRWRAIEVTAKASALCA